MSFLPQKNTAENAGSSGISRIVSRMIPVMALLNVCVFLLTLFGGFSLDMLLGFAVGFAYLVWCYRYLARTVEKAVGLDVKKAKRLMLSCYCVRYGGMFALCFVGYWFGIFSPLGIAVPQLYPRIVLSADALIGKNYFGKD